ncbi:MAG: sigma-70 family RNA polymerase sigma factor [Chloroflexi bacterium]|nr:sigma-70 family RNA polymerase sigma factor [Chloroflexota bacterium]
MFAYVASRVDSSHDADVVTQDVFMRIVNGLAGYEYRGLGSFSAWVFRIAYHEAVRHVKKHRLRDVPIDDVPDIAGEDARPEHEVERKERFAALRRLIARLTPREQEVITLRYFGEVRNRDIAVVLEINERTVASTLNRAVKHLRRNLHSEPVLWNVEIGEHE